MSEAPDIHVGSDAPAARVLKRKYHFHYPGLVFLLITILLVIGAINGQNNLLFWAFGLAVGAMLVSGFISGAILMGLELRASVEGPARAGKPLVLKYEVRNRNRFMPAFGLLIEEWTDPASKPVDGERGADDPAEPSWAAFMRRPVAFAAYIPARSTVVAQVEVRPWRRGHATFATVRVSSTFPFGLTLKSVVFSQVRGVLVQPWAPPIRAAGIKSFLAVGAAMEGQSRFRGHHGEYFGLRDYRAGDDIRRVAWKRSARSDTLVVRENASGQPRRLWLVVAPSGDSAGGDSVTTERVISLAAGLVDALSDAGTPCGLLDAGGRVLCRVAGGAPHADRVRDCLAVLGDAAWREPDRAAMIGGAALARDGIVVVGAGEVVAALREADPSRIDIDDAAIVDSSDWLRMPVPPSEAPVRAPTQERGFRRAAASIRAMWSTLVRSAAKGDAAA